MASLDATSSSSPSYANDPQVTSSSLQLVEKDIFVRETFTGKFSIEGGSINRLFVKKVDRDGVPGKVISDSLTNIREEKRKKNKELFSLPP